MLRAGTEMPADKIKGTAEGSCSIWDRGQQDLTGQRRGTPRSGWDKLRAEPESGSVVGLMGAGDEGRRGGAGWKWCKFRLPETPEIPVLSVWSLPTHPESRLMWPSSVLQRLRMRMGVPRALMPSANRDDTFTSAASCRRPPRGLRDPTLGA